MGRKRASSDDLQAGSKRVCTNDNAEDDDDENIENDDSISENERVGDCSQRPEFFAQGQLTEAENGIIEKITLQNFMCHSNLVVNLGPNVNFIIGRNGSGKSAIMTAIVVGLGGKASTTNRGNSLKGFIKDKCSTAIIRIQLRNRGTDAFKPDQYGSFIIVERTLSCDGIGAYKIMSENGQVISNKKEELNHILDQFNIQIDNPVSILNQDTSRNFLCASNPEGKYKFFLKATQLEQVSNDYLANQEVLEIIRINLEKKKETIPEMQIEVQQLEEKYKDLEQLNVLEGKIVELKRKIAWAQVIEKEKTIPEMQIEVQQLEEKYKDLEQLKVLKGKIVELKREIAWAQVKEKEKTIPEMQIEVQQLEEKYKDLQQLKVLEGKIVELKREIAWAQVKEKEKEANSLASEYYKRVQTRRSVKRLNSEILQTERKLRAEEQTRGKIEEITKQLVEAKARLDAVKASMKRLTKFSKRLNNVLKQRVTNFAHYRHYIALRAKNNFRMMLSQRGYTGKMKIDHKNEQLILHVNGDQTLKAGSNNSESLSGGERSFSTISFIMALWDAMEAPFKCLDEFDVFMDMLNRRINMQMMMKVALEQQHTQFILLTPQDMSNVGGGRHVKIFRLQDPERGQVSNSHTEG